MKKSEFKEQVKNILSYQVDELSWDEKISLIKQIIIEEEQKKEFDESNKGKSWTDEELRIILRAAPTKENCMVFARAFKRGYGSIEQIYRWAAEDKEVIAQKRPDDSFVKQIKRIAKEIGFRAT